MVTNTNSIMARQESSSNKFQSSVRLVDPLLTRSNVAFSASNSITNSLHKSNMGPITSSKHALEEKFKKYVSEADILFKTLSKVSESTITPENMCDSAHLLDRNTESFKCLAQLMLSNSSLMKNRLFLFPPLEDPGIKVAFEFEEPQPENDDVGIEKYKKMCKEMEIVPISRIIHSLEMEDLDLKYYGLTCQQIKALTEAMKANARVQNLILQDNWLTVEMTQMVSDMIVENTSLQYLSLKECRIGVEGAQKLGEVLASLQSLKAIDLSFNDLGDKGLLGLRDGLMNNVSLKKLNISHNRLTEDSAETLEKVLVENKYLEELDLSWNEFNTADGNKRLFNGFSNSDRIQILNLAWNGFGVPLAVRPIARYIKKSKNLEELDLSNNRLAGPSLRAIRAAIHKNHSLRVVQIGNNIYSPEEAHFLLTALAGKTKDPLNVLDMKNMYVKKESKPILNKIKHIGKTAKIGGILSDYEIHGPNPRLLIYQRCRYILQKPKRAKARKDFGHFILSLPEKSLTHEEFQKELKKQKIKKLDRDLVQGLMSLFMKKGIIECPELVKDYMAFYPDTVLPPPKPKKAKKGKKGKRGKKSKDDEEREVKVHDLETAEQSTAEPAEGEITDDSSKKKARQSSTLIVSPSRKSIKQQQSQLQSHNNLNQKSVSIMPEASFMSENEIHKDGPVLDAAPTKSIIKGRDSSENITEDHPIEKNASKSGLSNRRSSTKIRGSKASIHRDSKASIHRDSSASRRRSKAKSVDNDTTANANSN